MINLIYPFDWFIQKRRYFTASTMELRLFRVKPSSLFVSESTNESMVLPHVLETAVTVTIATRYTRSTTYKPETYPNLRSIPTEAWPGDNFVQIFNIPISHIPVDAFISYSNLEWIHLDNLGLHYIEEGAFRGKINCIIFTSTMQEWRCNSRPIWARQQNLWSLLCCGIHCREEKQWYTHILQLLKSWSFQILGAATRKHLKRTYYRGI